MTSSSSRWRFAVLPFVSLCILLPNLIRERGLAAGGWPAWRPVILDVLLVVAGAALVAGAASGVHARHEAKRHA